MEFKYKESTRKKQVFDFIKDNTPVTIKQVQNHFNFTRQYSSKILNKLREDRAEIVCQYLTENKGSLVISKKYYSFAVHI